MRISSGLAADDSTSSLPAGKLCIEVTPASKVAYISEELCIGCGICVKVSRRHGSHPFGTLVRPHSKWQRL